MAAQGTAPTMNLPPYGYGANSQGSSTHFGLYQSFARSQSLLFQPSHHEEGPAADNGVEEGNFMPQVSDKQHLRISYKEDEPNIERELNSHTSIIDVENEETIEKYMKYEADYACHLLAKYFSDKNIYEDDIFEDVFTIDGKSVKSSRSPCTRSCTDRSQSYIGPNEGTSLPDASMAEYTPDGTYYFARNA